MPQETNVAEILESFEEKWKDRGDERYGLAKHNNTILQNQIDWLRQKLLAFGQAEYLRGKKETQQVTHEHLTS